jgi:hypothetical protein
LGASYRAEMDARRPPGEDAADIVLGGVPHEQKDGHDVLVRDASKRLSQGEGPANQGLALG